MIDQVLSDAELTSDRFREWKEANAPLVQEISLKQDQQVEPEDEAPTIDTATTDATEMASAVAAPLVETSL